MINAKILSLDCFGTILKPIDGREIVLPPNRFIDRQFARILNFTRISSFSENHFKRFRSENEIIQYENFIIENMELDTELLNKIFEKISFNKLIVVSDTFFSSKRLNRILLTKGLDLSFDIITSSDSKIAKKYGLYNLILEKFEVFPHEMIHIGDDVLLDVVQPAKIGIITMHVSEFYE